MHFRVLLCRLFSCGTSKVGESYLMELNDSEGDVKRIYNGFQKRSSGVVQFHTTRNRFLAAGDEFVIKFWDMDSTNLFCQIEADGGLPVSNSGVSCYLVLYVLSHGVERVSVEKWSLGWLEQFKSVAVVVFRHGLY